MFDADNARSLSRVVRAGYGEIKALKNLVFEDRRTDAPAASVSSDRQAEWAWTPTRRGSVHPRPNRSTCAGFDWPARGREISFRSAREASASVRLPQAERAVPIRPRTNTSVTIKPVARWLTIATGRCRHWQAPISSAELVLARNVFGAANSKLMTGAALPTPPCSRTMSSTNIGSCISRFSRTGDGAAAGLPAAPGLGYPFGGPGPTACSAFREIFDLKMMPIRYPVCLRHRRRRDHQRVAWKGP